MAMDLEATTPTPPNEASTPPEPVPAVAAPAEPPAPEQDADDAQALEVAGQKMVPLSALKATRDEIKTLREKAAKADQYEAYLIQKAPYLKVLEDNPGLLQQQPQRQAPAAPPDADPDLVELARSLDYYKSDGTPDLERAAKHDQIIQRRATKIAQQLVQPLAQTNARNQTMSTFEKFAQQKLPNGQAVDKNLLAKYVGSLAQQGIAVNDQIGYIAWSLAAVEQMQQSGLPPAPAAPNRPPLHTESAGNVPRRPTVLSPVEHAVLAARGMDEKTYQERSKGFTPGRPSSLED